MLRVVKLRDVKLRDVKQRDEAPPLLELVARVQGGPTNQVVDTPKF